MCDLNISMVGILNIALKISVTKTNSDVTGKISYKQ